MIEWLQQRLVVFCLFRFIFFSINLAVWQLITKQYWYALQQLILNLPEQNWKATLAGEGNWPAEILCEATTW